MRSALPWICVNVGHPISLKLIFALTPLSTLLSKIQFPLLIYLSDFRRGLLRPMAISLINPTDPCDVLPFRSQWSVTSLLLLISYQPVSSIDFNFLPPCQTDCLLSSITEL
ncbi:hypothetical protein LINPERPRIM_LOCUS32611 [Linum perenne]